VTPKTIFFLGGSQNEVKELVAGSRWIGGSSIFVGQKKLEETRGQEAAEEKVEAAGERDGEKGNGRKGKGMRPKCRRRRPR